MRCHGGSVFLASWIALALLPRISSSSSVDRTGDEVWRVRARSSRDVEHVMNLASLYEMEEWVEVNQPNEYVDLMVRSDEKESVRRALRDAALPFSTMIADVEEKIRRHSRRKRDVNDTTQDEFSYSKFNTWEAIEGELKRLAKERSDIIRLQSIGKTHEGRELYMLRISNNITEKITKPVALIDAGIHAREWVSISTCLYIINQLIENPEDDFLVDAFLDSYDFVFFPVLNPDGYSYTWTDDRLWRKNRSPNKGSSCIGVDLNRNWDYEWGGEGTSSSPCAIDYKGPAPFSELETTAVKKWIEAHKSKVVLYLNFHAYGQLWMTPYGYSTVKPSNEPEMLRYSKIATDALAAFRGTNYNFGPVYTTIYPASSISVDWVRGAENILIAYTIELPDKGFHGFITPEKEITPIGYETWLALRELLITLGVDKNLLRTEEMVIV